MRGTQGHLRATRMDLRETQRFLRETHSNYRAIHQMEKPFIQDQVQKNDWMLSAYSKKRERRQHFLQATPIFRHHPKKDRFKIESVFLYSNLARRRSIKRLRPVIHCVQR